MYDFLYLYALCRRKQWNNKNYLKFSQKYFRHAYYAQVNIGTVPWVRHGYYPQVNIDTVPR